jgi:hypothetical protein
MNPAHQLTIKHALVQGRAQDFPPGEGLYRTHMLKYAHKFAEE